MKTDERFYCSQVLAISDETRCTSFLKLLLNWASGIKYSRVFFTFCRQVSFKHSNRVTDIQIKKSDALSKGLLLDKTHD